MNKYPLHDIAKNKAVEMEYLRNILKDLKTRRGYRTEAISQHTEQLTKLEQEVLYIDFETEIIEKRIEQLRKKGVVENGNN